jgi:hypothetical protein
MFNLGVGLGSNSAENVVLVCAMRTAELPLAKSWSATGGAAFRVR